MARWLILICLAALAGTLYWVWTRVEPDVRYRRILSALRHSREGHPRGDQFWSNLSWFPEGSQDSFLDRIFHSLASSDPDEREAAAVLATNLDSWEELRNLTDPSVPLLPPATEEYPSGNIRFGIHGALKQHADTIGRLAFDERPLVRRCFLELIWGHRDRFSHEVAAIATDDPNLELRLKAIPKLMYGVLSPDLETLRRLSKDSNSRIRLRATCLLGVEGKSLEALQDCILLLTDPGKPLEATERTSTIESILDMYPELTEHGEKTKNAIRTSPEALRAVGDEWRAWFRSNEFEDFVAEVSKRF